MWNNTFATIYMNPRSAADDDFFFNVSFVNQHRFVDFAGETFSLAHRSSMVEIIIVFYVRRQPKAGRIYLLSKIERA